MSTRILPAFAITPVVLPTSPFLLQRGLNQALVDFVEIDLGGILALLVLDRDGFLPNGRTMKTLVMT